MDLETWIEDERFPEWVFRIGRTSAMKITLEGKNPLKGLDGQVFLNEDALQFSNTAILEVDQKKQYLVDRASIDPEAWLSKGGVA